MDLIKTSLSEIKNIGKELNNHVENVGKTLTNSVDALKKELNDQISKVSSNVENTVNLKLENVGLKMDELKKQVQIDFTTVTSLMDKINELEKERVFTRAFLDKTFLKVHQTINGDYMMQYECPYESCNYVSILKKDFKSHVNNDHEFEQLPAEKETTEQETNKHDFNCISCCFSSNSKSETDTHIQNHHMQVSVEQTLVFAKKTCPTKVAQDQNLQTKESQDYFDDIDTSEEPLQDTEQLLSTPDFFITEDGPPPPKKKSWTEI